MVWSLIIGAVAGWLAGKFIKGHGFGLWVNIVVGIIGAFIGRFAPVYFWHHYGWYSRSAYYKHNRSCSFTLGPSFI
jgi:uncharacterized membrane protein YeaQ/YmgE (transglycosylase-associated protein family)